MIPGILLYIEDFEVFDQQDEEGNFVINDGEFRKIIRSLMNYAKKGEGPKGLSPVGMIAYGIVKNKLDREIASYKAKVEGGRRGGQASGSKGKQAEACLSNLKHPESTSSNLKDAEEKEKENVYETEHENVFFKGDGQKEKRGCKPPTLEEVKEYVRTAGIETDAEAFFDYFSSCGWMRGVNPMTDWQAACRSWRNNRGKQIIPINAKRGSVYNYQERETELTSTIDQQMEGFMRQQEAAK